MMSNRARRMLEHHLRNKAEATLKNFGNKNQDFTLYRWLADEYAAQRDAQAERTAKAGNGR